MRYIVLLVIGGTLWLLINGFGELNLALQNPSIQNLSIDQFNQAPNTSGWFRITDGYVDLTEAMYREKEENNIKEVYLPVHSKAESNEAMTNLLLKTDDAAIIATVKLLHDSLDAFPSEEAQFGFLTDHGHEIIRAEPIEGLTEYGMNTMPTSARTSAHGLASNLSEQCVVLHHNDKPTLIWGILKLGLGCMIPVLVFMIYRAGRKDESSGDDQRTMTEESGTKEGV